MDLVEYNPSNTNRHPWELARYRIFKYFLRRYNSSTEKITILDVGCGDCFFAQSLLKDGLNATIIGIDPGYTEAAIREKRKEISHPGFHLFRSPEDARELLNKPVHFVLLLDVIEHIENETGFLEELVKKNLIDTDTKFIISVPAYQSLFTSHDTFLLHYRRYSKKLLRKTVIQCGLHPLTMGYFFFSLLPVRVLQKLKEKVLGKPKKNYGLGRWNGGAFLTSVIKNWLLLDFKITRALNKIGIALPGLSTYCVCQKSA